mmetsp:Transcript_55515/g.136040  ORF Transcript_55515/g.136040 Transcript_55515/m.136040 type:complete len:216 (-) Transcript_55515:825-1472(-)
MQGPHSAPSLPFSGPSLGMSPPWAHPQRLRGASLCTLLALLRPFLGNIPKEPPQWPLALKLASILRLLHAVLVVYMVDIVLPDRPRALHGVLRGGPALCEDCWITVALADLLVLLRLLRERARLPLDGPHAVVNLLETLGHPHSPVALLAPTRRQDLAVVLIGPRGLVGLLDGTAHKARGQLREERGQAERPRVWVVCAREAALKVLELVRGRVA